MRAQAEKYRHKYTISGELFVTTQGGDVKKAAGLGVRVIPITDEFRNRLAELIERERQYRAAWDAANKEWEALNPEPDERPAYDSNISWDERQQYDHQRDRWSKQTREALDRQGHNIDNIRADMRALLSETTQETSTNSEGKFRIDVEAGLVVLISDVFSMANNPPMVWCKVVEVKTSDLELSLNQDSAVLVLCHSLFFG